MESKRREELQRRAVDKILIIKTASIKIHKNYISKYNAFKKLNNVSNSQI